MFGIEAELGTLGVKTHRITNDAGKIIYNVNVSFFESKNGKERHHSSRLNELMYEFASEISYRNCEKYLNRIRQQEEGVKTTTIRNHVERAGNEIREHIQEQLSEALIQNGFNESGEREPHESVPSIGWEAIDEKQVYEAAKALGIAHNVKAKDYENTAFSVDIAVDDVGVKRQTSERPNPESNARKRKYAYQTVVHVGKEGQCFIFNEENQAKALVALLGFLLHNCLLWGKQLVFYVDGETSLFTTIKRVFGFLPIKIILDWYHVDKKMKERLSMGMTGYKVRNPFMEELRPFLWMGDVDGAIALLKALPDKHIKNIEHITKLIEYLTRNKNYIPCYALRAKLGLCNSSNRGEKANDLAVSNRQKHNGMSWSREGSLGLGSVCTTAHNGEIKNWAYKRSIDLSLRKNAA